MKLPMTVETVVEGGTKMSKHNYSKYSNNKAEAHNPEFMDVPSFVATEIVEEVETPVLNTPVLELTPEVVETVTVSETVTGIVANCAKLNVRVRPSTEAKALCVLDAGTEIEINVSKSTAEWVNVYTAAGVEGYCMKKFVNANL